MTKTASKPAVTTEKGISAEKNFLRKMFDFADKKGQLYFDVFAAAVILALTVWGIVNVYHSIGYSIDEAFYLTIPKRILAGDGLLTDEWQLSQLSSVLLLPFVWIWYGIKGSSEGMYMFFSVLFCVVRGLFSGGVYTLLRKHRYFALAAAACLSQYATLNYNALSYNTIGLYAAVLLMCLAVRLSEKESAVSAVFCGVLFAVLVLCNPVAIALFPALCIAAVIYHLRNNAGKTVQAYFLFTPRGFWRFVAGILPVFLYFCAVLFKNSSIKDIIASVPYILQDPEHMVLADGAGQSTVSGLGMLTGLTDNIGIAVFILAVILGAAALLLKKKSYPAGVLLAFLASAATFGGALVHYFSPACETQNPGLVYFAFFLEGVVLYFLNGRKNKAVFFAFVCGGFFYAVCMEISSNLGYQAHINGYISALPGVLLLLRDCVLSARYGDKERKAVRAAVCASLCLVIFAAGFYVFGINGTLLTNRGQTDIFEIKSGFYAGKRMEKSEYSNYVFLKSDISALDEIAENGEKFYVFGNLPQAYLETEKLGIASMSAWLFPDLQLDSPSARERFFAYYKIFPENIPDYIYVPFFGEFTNGTKNLNPKKLTEELIKPYFSGEITELNHGLVFKVDKILYEGEKGE